jgi:hypothetical protein
MTGECLSREVEPPIDSVALPEPPAKSDRENPTSEPKRDENVVSYQNEEPVAIAANFGVDSGLDKRKKPPFGAEPGASAAGLASSPEAAEIPRFRIYQR